MARWPATEGHRMDNASYYSATAPPSRGLVTGQSLLVEGGMLLLAIALAWWLGPDPEGTFTVTFGAVGTGILAGILLFVVVFSVLELPVAAVKGFRQQVAPLGDVFRRLRPIDLIWISILAGLGEEALFRGVLMHHANAWLGVPAGVALSSLLFGLAHALSPAYVVFATLLGVILALLYVATDNLLVPVVAHAVYDFLALIYILYFGERLRAGLG